MLKKIVENIIEEKRRQGYDCILTTEEIVMNGKEMVFPLGNDIAVISGVVFNPSAMAGSNNLITIVSETDSVCGTAREVASMGVSLFKVMKGYIIIKREEECDESESIIVQICKITPIINN